MTESHPREGETVVQSHLVQAKWLSVAEGFKVSKMMISMLIGVD